MYAAMSIRYDSGSRQFCERERREGKRHVQAVLAMARRRVNVVWALIRDYRRDHITAPVSAAGSGATAMVGSSHRPNTVPISGIVPTRWDMKCSCGRIGAVPSTSTPAIT